MQDIDFSKLYPNKKLKEANNHQKGHEHDFAANSNIKKFSLLGFVCLFAFTLGLFGGMYVSKKKEAAQLESEKPAEEIQDTAEDSSTELTKHPKESEEKLISENISPKEEISFNENKSQKNDLKGRLQKSENKKTYLIWTKTYSNRTLAYRHGHFLKKQDLPVFLAKSGDKMKLYVGPLYGKKQAYQVLSQIKKWDSFRAAILHEKKQ